MLKRYSIIALVLAYLCPGVLASIASVVGIGAGLNSIFGGNSGPTQGTPAGGRPYYQPTGQGSADANYQALSQLLSGNNTDTNALANQLYLQSLQDQLGTNYAPYLQAAGQSGALSGQQANMAQSGAQALQGQAGVAQGQGQSAFDAGLNTYLTSLDPQSALFNQLQQQVTDQTNAGQAARGLGNSAQGAGELQQNLNYFDTNWQNQQLARQQQGAQALNSGIGAANQSNQLMGADLSGANSLLGSGANAALASGQTPLSAYQYAAAGPGNAANTYAQGITGLDSLLSNQLGNDLQYLGFGNNTSALQNSSAFGQQQFNANQQQAGANGLIQGLNGLSNSGAGSWLSNIANSNGIWTSNGNSPVNNTVTTGDMNSWIPGMTG